MKMREIYKTEPLGDPEGVQEIYTTIHQCLPDLPTPIIKTEEFNLSSLAAPARVE
jgi:hypothetical protein